MVKRWVPFLFSCCLQRPPYQKLPLPRRGCRANHKTLHTPRKRENGGICFPRRPCRGPPQPWLELTNLAVTTGYHRWLVLSTLNLRFSPKKGVRRRDFSVFSTFCPKNLPCFGRKPTCFLLLFKVVLAIIVTQDFVGRFSFLSTPCSWSCRSRQFKTVSPPESRLCSAVFQRLNS